MTHQPAPDAPTHGIETQNKSVPDQSVTDYISRYHELEQRKNPPKPQKPAPEKRVSIKELFVANKLFLAVGGLVPLVFFGSMIATQVLATDSFPPPQSMPTSMSQTQATTNPLSLSTVVKVANASSAAIPGAYASANQLLRKKATGKGETIISQKSTTSTNPYKLQPPKAVSPAQINAPKKQRVTPMALPPVVSPPTALPPKQSPSVPVQKSVSNPAPDQALKELTNNVVSTLQRLKQQEANPTAAVPNTDNLRQAISALVASATSKGKSSAYVQSLIDDALAGRNAIPTALANADGKLDTQLLLSSVLPKKNLASIGNTQASYLSALESESNALTQKKQAKTAPARKRRYIIVKQGDNLSRIAKRVYGDPLAYVRIYRANQTLLINANTLTIGMRLRVPR